MEIEKYIYLYSKYLLTDFVKETILIENWEGQDFDFRYIEYYKIFDSLWERFADKSEDEFIKFCKKKRKVLAQKFYKKMDNNLIDSVCTKNKKLRKEVKSKLKDIIESRNKDSIDNKYLIKIRKVEEEILRGDSNEYKL